MGLRFRKSINLGGGFKVNLSKSGVGYSWGVKGYRVTKTAKGTRRKTVSIPGTGLSYVSESGKRKSDSSAKPTSHNQTNNQHITDNINTFDTQEIKNAVASEMVSDGLEDMLASATTALKLQKIALISTIAFLSFGVANPPLLLLALVAIVAFCIINVKGVIDINYSFEDEQETLVAARMAPLKRIAKSQKLWYLTKTSKVVNKKYAAGANNAVARKKSTTKATPPFPFKTNAESVTFF